MRKVKLICVAFFLGVVALFLLDGGGQDDLLWYAQEIEQTVMEYKTAHPIRAVIFYVLAFAVSVMLFLPLGIFFLLMGGAVFGMHFGAFLASVANLLGAVVGFLIARYFFFDDVHDLFKDKIKHIDQAIEKNSIFYLFLLRLAPVLPSEVVNVILALTPVRMWQYIWVTFVARYPINYIYAGMGENLSEIERAKDLFSPELFFGLSIILVIMVGSKYLFLKTSP